MKKYYLFLVIIGSILFSGCVKNNPLPTWLIVKKFKLVDNPQINEGELTESITEGWIYINDKFVGIFELPCKVPVLYEGENMKVTVYPTVRMNGIRNTKVQHPYLDGFITYTNLKSGDSTFVEPTTMYNSSAAFWIEDFQSGTIKLTNGTDNTATIGLEQDLTNPGNRYGKIILNATTPTWSVYTADGLTHTQGARVILEMDYCNTTGISTRLIAGKIDGSIQEHPHIRANKQDRTAPVWKKIYIDMSELVGLSGGYKFWYGLRSYLDANFSDDIVMIDNIKVIYR